MINGCKTNFRYISKNQKLSEEFIRKYKNKVDWEYISIHQNLSEEFIREFRNRVYWANISMYQKLSEEFIREFKYYVRWQGISFSQKMSEEFIREFKDKVNWYSISKSQKLSEEFIKEFKDKVSWSNISEYQKLSESFIREFNLSIPEDCLIYKTKEEKIRILKSLGFKVIHNNYLISFISHCIRNIYDIILCYTSYRKDKDILVRMSIDDTIRRVYNREIIARKSDERL